MSFGQIFVSRQRNCGKRVASIENAYGFISARRVKVLFPVSSRYSFSIVRSERLEALIDDKLLLCQPALIWPALFQHAREFSQMEDVYTDPLQQ